MSGPLRGIGHDKSLLDKAAFSEDGSDMVIAASRKYIYYCQVFTVPVPERLRLHDGDKERRFLRPLRMTRFSYGKYIPAGPDRNVR